LIARKRLADLHETAPVWLPDYAIAEGKPMRVTALLTLAFALARELSGEAELERTQPADPLCFCAQPNHGHLTAQGTVDLLGERGHRRKLRQVSFDRVTEKRFNGINRCC